MKKLWSLAKTGLTALMRRPRWMVELSCVILLALVWFAGPFIGITSVETRVKLIIAISVVRVLANLLDHYFAQRKAGQLETSLQLQAQQQMATARPDRKEDIAALRSQFEKAIVALKASNLGEGAKARPRSMPYRGTCSLAHLPRGKARRSGIQVCSSRTWEDRDRRYREWEEHATATGGLPTMQSCWTQPADT